MLSLSFKRHLIAFLLAFALPLALIFVWWGGLRSVSIASGEAGPYTYAYLEQTGDYAKLPDLTIEVSKALLAQGVTPGLPINVLYDNPDLVNVGKRRARAGFLVPPEARVNLPLRIETLPRRKVLIASVRAGSLIAPSKAYAALDRYQQARGRGINMPTVEIYTPADMELAMGVFRVEMPDEAVATP